MKISNSKDIDLLLDVDPRIGIVSIVGKIKGYTSHIIRKEFPWMKKRLPSLWTRGKFIASVGSVSGCDMDIPIDWSVTSRYFEDEDTLMQVVGIFGNCRR